MPESKSRPDQEYEDDIRRRQEELQKIHNGVYDLTRPEVKIPQREPYRNRNGQIVLPGGMVQRSPASE